MGRKRINFGNCINGCNKVIHCRKLCRSCYLRLNYEESGRALRGSKKHIDHPIGTIIPDVSGYNRIKIGVGKGARDWIKNHRYVMEQILGRKLLDFENVHHKNGNKRDDSPSNLELWITKQPKGQRPADLVKYAEWILKQYKKK